MWWMLEDVLDEVRYGAAEIASKCGVKICEAKNAVLRGKSDDAYDDEDESEVRCISNIIETEQPVHMKLEKCNSEDLPD